MNALFRVLLLSSNRSSETTDDKFVVDSLPLELLGVGLHESEGTLEIADFDLRELEQGGRQVWNALVGFIVGFLFFSG